ncbi:MAG: hypothetical protein Q9201_006996 [Fulgogasparrea decipioides]
MAATSSGGKSRLTKVAKTGTPSKRKHRFETFNQRVARLDIDPIHKIRRTGADLNEDDPTASYFKAELDKWKDLNLLENFTNFVREVSPLCNTLPQVLHYEKDVAKILTAYIKKGDSFSLEPLLNLLSCFAHDLGSIFESHFSDAVTLLASLAVKSPEFEVIEWCFNCLAWLFKYLSRLLVPDLRPLLRIMSPLLGKEPQKIFITRFAAESMSFLVRKAVLVYHKNQKPLQNAVDFILKEVDELDRQEHDMLLYYYGLKTLLVDAIKGIDRGLHSTGPTLYGCLVESTFFSRGTIKGRMELLEGVTVGLIHKTDASTFWPLLNILLQMVQQEMTLADGLNPSADALVIAERIFCVLSTVRKGSRVQDWGPMLDALLELLRLREEDGEEPTGNLHQAAVMVMQSAPLDVVLPKVRPIMDRISNVQNQNQFLIFCRFFCNHEKERFESLIHPYFLQFLAAHWQSQQRQLCWTLPKVIGQSPKAKVSCPVAWQKQIVSCFELAERSGEEALIADCYSYINALRHMAVSTSTIERIMQILQSMIDSCLQPPHQIDPKSMFSLGAGLKAYAEYETTSPSDSPRIWRSASIAARYFKRLPSFLEGILTSLRTESLLDRELLDNLVGQMTENLHTSSHVLRDLSLQVINTAYTKVHGDEAETLATALMIENTALDLKSARTASMLVRKLASQYKNVFSHHWLQRAISHFCFGIHTYKLSPIWDDALEVLKRVCESQHGEELVSDLAFQWLEVAEPMNDTQGMIVEQPSRRSLGQYECSNLIDMDISFRNCVAELQKTEIKIVEEFRTSHAMPHAHPVNAPAIALRILMGIPKTAEKKSRRLVPLFLQWAAHDKGHKSPREHSLPPSNEDGHPEHHRLSGQDRKGMLRLFALFNNPKTLYRSADVFDALRNLLANGDIDIQKSALNALFTWKMEALQPYQPNLLNILDDSRFRDEISTFLHADEQNSIIQIEHRPQLMPVLLRLLYGKLIARTGNQIAKRTQSLKRKVVLEALSRFEDSEIKQFLDIAFGTIIEVKGEVTGAAFPEMLSPRKQVGLLNMAKDMLTTLGTRLVPFTSELTMVVIYCTFWACKTLSSEELEIGDSGDLQTSLVKTVRQLGLQCLNLLFQNCTISELQLHLPTVFSAVINPRLESLAVDTAQSVSGLLQLFSTWASSRHSATFFVEYNPSVLEIVSSCLQVPFAKEEVKTFVLEDIFKRLIGLVDREHASGYDPQQLQIVERVLRPNVDVFLIHVGVLLRSSPSRELLASAIEYVTQLASIVQGSSQVQNILEIASFLLNQPSQRVSPRIKGDLLQILRHFVPQHELRETKDLQDIMFSTVSSLFGFFKDRQNRTVLVEVFCALAGSDEELRRVAALCRSLNSYSTDKVDEPDFDERLKAFNTINERDFGSLTAKEWRPILQNMLFYIRDTEELAIRSNASFALCRFIEANTVDTSDEETGSNDLIRSLLLPALRRGASEMSELVRAEYLTVMAHLVRYNNRWNQVSDMSVLLVADDEEASFFSNVLHIQQHRRLRALRRLATEARQNRLQTNNVAHFFLPLIEHFVFDKAHDETAHNLSSETVATIGALALALEWSHFRAIFRRYLAYVESKPDLEKTIIRLVGVLTDALVSAAEKQGNSPSVALSENNKMQGSSGRCDSALTRTLPRTERLAEDLRKHILPALTKYLHEKNESTVSLRVPVAVSAVKLLKLLPSSQAEECLPPILTDVCNILRSRAQESRDLTRKTLVDIAVVAGSAYFGFILKELRRALARGYQLHVLSYTVHSILVGTASVFKLGDLDYCLPQIVAVIMDDTFGATGQEKDAEEYISQMKEVKSSKSYDSMEIIAKNATAENFLHLIRPLQNLLEEKLDLKALRKIDELLRRISLGLLHNETIESRQVLVFCHEIVREVYNPGEEQGGRVNGQDHRNKRFLVNVKGAEKANRGASSSSRLKLVRFAFDLLRSVLHRYDNLRTPANLAGFMPMLGDAMLQANEEIQMSAIRLLTTIIAIPLREIDDNAAIYVAEAVKIVKGSPSTNTELAQAALKLVSAILRERRGVEVRETDLAYLLKRIQPDLEELDRQGVAFNLLKAVMARKIVIVEVYEVLETVASMMITNHTRGARDQARSVYFDFLVHYPQGKGRYCKQLTFLVKNLDYKHEEGRQSVMEAIHLLLSKLSDNSLQSAVETFFVPLVMVMVNDESVACREMAGALVKAALERADAERSGTFLTLLRTWLSQLNRPLLVRVALQVYGIYFDIRGKRAEKELSFLLDQLTQVLKANDGDSKDADWELLYYALQAFFKTCQILPTASFAVNTAKLWASVRQCLSFPHVWVKLSAAKLYGLFFADIARTNAESEKPDLPLEGSGGLLLSGPDIEHITRASLALFKVPTLTEELATQTVRNLVFLAKTMNGTSWTWGQNTVNGHASIEDVVNDGGEAMVLDVDSKTQSGPGFILQCASAVLRRGPLTTRESSLIPVKAAMQLIWALCSNIPMEAIKPNIVTVLLPLQHLTDPSISPPFSSDEGFVNGYKTLVSHGSEIMAMLQKKLGTTEYIKHLTKVREGIKERREDRRVKRRIEAVAEPEKIGRMKKRKGEKKKEKRKEKSAGQRSRRRGW